MNHIATATNTDDVLTPVVVYYRTVLDDPRDLRAMESRVPEAALAQGPPAAARTKFPETWVFTAADSG